MPHVVEAPLKVTACPAAGFDGDDEKRAVVAGGGVGVAVGVGLGVGVAVGVGTGWIGGSGGRGSGGMSSVGRLSGDTEFEETGESAAATEIVACAREVR
jgi:hypothetical protein